MRLNDVLATRGQRIARAFRQHARGQHRLADRNWAAIERLERVLDVLRSAEASKDVPA